MKGKNHIEYHRGGMNWEGKRGWKGGRRGWEGEREERDSEERGGREDQY